MPNKSNAIAAFRGTDGRVSARLPAEASARHGRRTTVKRSFEPGAYAADGSFVFVCNPSPDCLRRSYRMLLAEVGSDVAPLRAVQSVYAYNPLAWWAIFRSADESRAGAELAGFCAYLPLNKEGFATLKHGTLNARDPDLNLIAPRGEDPAALYLWAIVAHGLSDLGGKLIGHAIGLDLYERLPMFGTIGTEAGLAALRRSSKSASDAAALEIGSLFEIRLPERHLEHQRSLKIFEGRSRPSSPEAGRFATLRARLRLEAHVASTTDDMAKTREARWTGWNISFETLKVSALLHRKV